MKALQTNLAPQVVGPYSQAIIAGEFIFCSGQIPINPETGLFVEGGIKKQTEQVIKNLRAVLQEAGVDLKNIVKTEVYLANMEDFAVMNAIYSEKFITQPYPARVTVEVSRLPKEALIEMSCIAQRSNK